MRGFVPTPPEVVDQMVELLFDGKAPAAGQKLLDPGCGTGVFIEGVRRWGKRRAGAVPRIVGVELDPARAGAAASLFRGQGGISIRRVDFLQESTELFDFVIGNPPYVSLAQLSEAERSRFRSAFETATGRFDLYMLFFEQALRQLKPGGRLVFITPEKFLYVSAASALRRLLAQHHVREIRFANEATFPSHVTYPTITVVDKVSAPGLTRVIQRDGRSRLVRFPADGSSLLPVINGQPRGSRGAPTLLDASLRVSCGIATGADEVFVRRTSELNQHLRRFAMPTIAGRQLLAGSSAVISTDSLLIPYDVTGRLLEEHELGPLAELLHADRERLEKRSCTARKPWYAFHDSVPLHEILRPKILCKDISEQPVFWLDRAGELVPRHSVYYIVPRHAHWLEPLAEYLNGPESRKWLLANCQRAANGFLRLQSNVLKRLPVPLEFVQENDELANSHG